MRPYRHRQRHRHRQRGTTLVEALVAFLALSFGVIAIARMQGQLRLHADTARQRAEAVRLGAEELEHLRAFASVAASDTARSYADVVPASRTIAASTGAPGSRRFTLDRRVEPAGVASAREVTVVVGWQDTAGAAQQVVLASMIAANDPALGAALALVPSGSPAASAP